MPTIEERQLPYLALIASLLAQKEIRPFPPKLRGMSDQKLRGLAESMSGPLKENDISSILYLSGLSKEEFLHQTGIAEFRRPKPYPTAAWDLDLVVQDSAQLVRYLAGMEHRLPAMSGLSAHRDWNAALSNIQELLSAAAQGQLDVVRTDFDGPATEPGQARY